MSMSGTRVGHGASSALRNRNIAPAGLGEFDYHLGITNESSWIKRRFSTLVSWPASALSSLVDTTSTAKGTFGRKRTCMLLLALVMLGIGSTTFLAKSSNLNPSVTTSSGDEATSNAWNNRRAQIMNSILLQSVTRLEVLDDEDSPQYAALDWISEKDVLHLDPLDGDLVARYACAAFYFSVDDWSTPRARSEGNFSEFHSTWLSERHICDWSGIQCKEDDGISSEVTVTKFHFDAGYVNGPLVQEVVASFQNLEVLHFCGVGLQGPLPSNLGSLTKLKVLSLGDNDFTGSLPSELGRMSSLKLLGLHNNRLESVIPIELWNLTKLSALYLDGNGFRGAISTEVNNLKELVDFRLRNNHMDGPLPNALGDLSKSVK